LNSNPSWEEIFPNHSYLKVKHKQSN
jgi:hypothetical protein